MDVLAYRIVYTIAVLLDPIARVYYWLAVGSSVIVGVVLGIQSLWRMERSLARIAGAGK